MHIHTCTWLWLPPPCDMCVHACSRSQALSTRALAAGRRFHLSRNLCAPAPPRRSAKCTHRTHRTVATALAPVLANLSVVFEHVCFTIIYIRECVRTSTATAHVLKTYPPPNTPRVRRGSIRSRLHAFTRTHVTSLSLSLLVAFGLRLSWPYGRVCGRVGVTEFE